MAAHGIATAREDTAAEQSKVDGSGPLQSGPPVAGPPWGVLIKSEPADREQ